jgi:surfeit locus 1 family protein
MSGVPAQEPRRSLATLAGIVLVAVTILMALGVWQLQRGVEKQAFIAALNQAAAGEPKLDWNQAKPFERARLTGTFEGEATVFVRVTLPESLGVYVMTPLRTASERIFVNRGFLKTAQNGRPPAVATPAGTITITGLRRAPEPRGWFAPPDDVAARLFATRNPPLMAQVLGMTGIAADYLEAEPVAGVQAPNGQAPNGIDTREVIARIPDNHLVYALTWFGLAATLIAIFALLVLRTRTGRDT